MQNNQSDSNSATGNGNGAIPSDLPQPRPECIGPACNNFVAQINTCRSQQRMGTVDPLCGCTQEVAQDLADCESCVASAEIGIDNIDGSTAASTSQQQLNLFIGLCNAAISRSGFGTPILSSLSVSFSDSIDTATISISTTPLYPALTTTLGLPVTSGLGTGGSDGRPALQNSAHVISLKEESGFIFLLFCTVLGLALIK
ncbi:hypothetical protein VKT23_017458 [Stygiomarasmius scandens]|uniref:Uncharacterized protein n=1 Tax=Marasmiellus scandens TaxID=2682957 RepID=A0ABR1IU97_9AGAR